MGLQHVFELKIDSGRWDESRAGCVDIHPTSVA